MGSDQQHSASLFLLACLTHTTKLQVANLDCRKVRRKRNATLFFIEAAVQSVNLVFYIVPNIYILKRPCYFFGHVIFWCGWVRWTCWNTVRPPSPPPCPRAASPFPWAADVPAVCCLDWTQQPVDTATHRAYVYLVFSRACIHAGRCPNLHAAAMPRILCSSRTSAGQLVPSH